jgi:hypothetical protein
VIETLLRHVQPSGWQVVGARNWAHIRKLRAHGPAPNEQRNVAALALHAREAGARVLAFVRDGDDQSSRVQDIDAAIGAHEAKEDAPDIVGGVAVPVLEGWLLSLQGEWSCPDLVDRFDCLNHVGALVSNSMGDT